MRIKQILVALFFTVLIVSCGKENTKEADAKKEIIKKEGPKEAGEKAAKDIDVSELKTECEAVDAVITVADEMLELVEAVDSEEGASEEQKKEFKLLYEKTEEIEDYLKESDFSKKAFKKCPKYEILDSKMAKSRKSRKIFK
ncbi:hypothetical protein N9X82_01840 [Polaribacter sp.]|nr:hypothetical protein [Polaribacter sp.]